MSIIISLSIINSQSLLKLMSIELVIPSNHLIFCHPLLLPSIFSSIRVFSNESVLHIRWSKYWSFSFSINPFNEYAGLISFWMDWSDSLAVQGTLRSLLQHHSSKPSIIQHSAFFIVQLSCSYMTTGKIIALTRRTFAGKGMSLLLNMLSRLVITFLPRSKRLLILRLQSPSAVIFGAQENKVCHCFHCFPIYLLWCLGTMATLSSVPAWRIPGMGEPGWLPSMGSHRVGYNWSDLAAAAAWDQMPQS